METLLKLFNSLWNFNRNNGGHSYPPQKRVKSTDPPVKRVQPYPTPPSRDACRVQNIDAPLPPPPKIFPSWKSAKGSRQTAEEGEGMGAGGAAELPARRSSEWPSSLSYGSFAWVIINVARDKRRFSLPRRADDVATFLAARRARFMAARR